jgi:hypothetical protein
VPLVVVIAYSSITIGIRQDLSGPDGTLGAIKHIAAQVITGKNGGRQDRRFGNPLVVSGSRYAKQSVDACSVGTGTSAAGRSR